MITQAGEGLDVTKVGGKKTIPGAPQQIMGAIVLMVAKEVVPAMVTEIVKEAASSTTKETAENANSYATKTTAEKDELFTAAKRALKTARESTLPPILAATLGRVGTASSRSGFRRAVARAIRQEANHPLKFLLGANGKLRAGSGKGITADVWAEMPEIIEAGHALSAKALTGVAAGSDCFMVMSTWHNRMLSSTIEHSSIGGYMELDYALEIGGIPVQAATAYDWVAKGLLEPDLLATARKIVYD